jgi:hypothetical protein
MFFVPYIKGFEINCEKLIEDFGREKLSLCIKVILEEHVDWDGFKYVACGHRPNHLVTPTSFVIVLDHDYDLEALKNRPLGEIHPSLIRAESVLLGPDVFERTS